MSTISKNESLIDLDSSVGDYANSSFTRDLSEFSEFSEFSSNSEYLPLISNSTEESIVSGYPSLDSMKSQEV